MKQYYNVLSCYSFDEKNKDTGELTGKKKYCLKCNQIFQNGTMSRFSFNYYLNEDEFIDKFEKYIDVEKYNLGLEGKILEVVLVGTPSCIVEKIPEKKSS